MIIIIAKKYVDGKWAPVDGTELYSIGQLVDFSDGKTYKVTTIVGSKITLEDYGVISAND